jgi:cell division protein FtsQ
VPVTVAPPRGPATSRRGLPIDPRIRQRRIEVRREEGRRRLKFVVAVLAAVVLGATAFGITRSPLLAVHHVEVTGIAHTSRSDVVVAAGLQHRELMVDVHPGQVASRLAALPWVATAGVTRSWPTTVRIRITERTPVATVAGAAGQVADVDATGRVLAVRAAPAAGRPVAGPPPAAAPLPVITGLAPAGGPGSTLGPRAADALALVGAVARSYPAALAARITTVKVEANGDLGALVTPSVTVRLGSADRLDAKLVAIRTLLERVDFRGVAVVDVRLPDAPVLTRQGPPGTVSTTPRG